MSEPGHTRQSIIGHQAVYSRHINTASRRLVHAALHDDTDTIVEIAREIVKDAECRDKLKKWAEEIKEARRAFYESQGLTVGG